MLVRKINKAKWFQTNILHGEEVSADAITNCLRTVGNTLSVWYINSEEDINKAMLAIIANQDHLESIDVVIIDEKLFEDSGFVISSSPGETPVEELREIHRDITGLNYSLLGNVKNIIVEMIKKDKITRFTKVQLTKILGDAIKEGKIDISYLKESVRKKLQN
jgi:hypothetical protein